MKKQAALKQIQDIHHILSKSNEVFFQSMIIFYIGIMVLLVPVIEWGTHYFTFGFSYGKYSTLMITLFHIAFYWGMSLLISKTVRYKEKKKTTSNHPLVQKAFLISKPIVFAIVGSVIVFVLIGHGEFAFPVTYLLLGILWNLFGRFSNKIILNISWSYIFLGLIYIYITHYQIPYLAWYFTSYLGITYLIISKFLPKKTQTQKS